MRVTRVLVHHFVVFIFFLVHAQMSNGTHFHLSDGKGWCLLIHLKINAGKLAAMKSLIGTL